MPARCATLGIRAHSGWAATVVLSGTPQIPEVIFRRRIEIADPSIPGSKQPYHAAEPLPLDEATALIDRCSARTRKMSREAVRKLMDDSDSKGYKVIACGIILGSGRPLPELQSVLASHALIHSAEGEFFRDALVEAARHCRLPVGGVKERELFERGAAQLRLPTARLAQRIADLKESVGAPWAQDQKYAALAAWLALADAQVKER